VWRGLYRELDEGEGGLEVAEHDRVGAQALSEEGQDGARHLQSARQRLASGFRMAQIHANPRGFGWGGYPESHGVEHDVHMHKKQWPGDRCVASSQEIRNRFPRGHFESIDQVPLKPNCGKCNIRLPGAHSTKTR
jgi:hypothetical protein